MGLYSMMLSRFRCLFKRQALYIIIPCIPAITYIFLIAGPGYFSHKFSTLSDNIHKSIMPLGGEEVLPGPVQIAIKGLRQLDVSEYMLLGKFASEELLLQRMAEGAWPIRIKRNSIVAVSFRRDFDQSHQHKILWEENGVCIIKNYK